MTIKVIAAKWVSGMIIITAKTQNNDIIGTDQYYAV